MYYFVLPQFNPNIETLPYFSTHVNQFEPSLWNKKLQNQTNIFPILQQQPQNQQFCHQQNLYYVYSNLQKNNMLFSIPNQPQVQFDNLQQKDLLNKIDEKATSKDEQQEFQGGQKHIREKNQQNRQIKKKKSQTKNLIKNYGRAILTFILKNSQLRLKVLKNLGIDDSQFVEAVYMFREYIHTISAIRYIWQQHPFCKAFRILSCQYLRKHNLQHIFNSRVFKHNVYLKYQNKLMKSIQRPQQFQNIKQI